MDKRCTKFLKAKYLSRGCGWLLRARKYETSENFCIYKYVGLHTCGVEHATRRHTRIPSELIASLFVNHFQNSKGPSIREIQRIVLKEMHCNTSYWMCWKGNIIVKNIIHGTPKHGYSCLPAFSHMVELLNPGSSYSIMVNLMDESFIYYFLVFGACIHRYAHMRKVITVDGTHLYGKYGDVLVSAVAQDIKNHIFLIAFYVVDKENDVSWTFFFEKLKSIVEDEPDLCIISNRHISIANAFFRVYSYAHHGHCMRNLADYLHVNQHCGEHLYLLYAAAKANIVDEFSEHFAELKNNYPEAAHILENMLGFEKWSRAYFPGNRYDVMTTNIADSLNSVLMDELEYPVSHIFNLIVKKFGEKF
ncbi:uncharacterized protein LOC124889685 [Capsicum annuum]|uniref:uncharacterized protein LOC124889685 n=1 Tax=Capsicum annuum TaxID=4072 RepID=UPI001FB09CB6|nr:uncharacterized protein LOC124889685 [Capsicum annuum]